MVNAARRTGLICCLALLGVVSIHARDIAVWRVGDTADREVITPVALDVVDAPATADRRAEALAKTPAVFRVIASITNTMVLKVSAAFAESHANFLAGLQQKFQQASLNETAVQSTAFADFVSAFNAQNKKFPVTTALAAQWARGESSLATLTNLVEQLLQTTSRPVRSDAEAEGFELGATVRLVPVRSSKDTVTLEKAEQRGTVVPLTSVTTVTRLRGLFRRDFSTEDQSVARTLATYIHPNAELDTNLTQQARDRAVSRVGVVVQHYTVGAAVVRRGQVIDAKAKAALTQLNEALPPEPVSQPTALASSGKIQKPEFQLVPASNPPAKNLWLVAVIAAVSTVALLGIWWLLASRRRPAVTVPALPVELAPQIAEMLKLAVVQELAVQRRELLQTQQIAAEEVVRLMHRLNELHIPSPERLAAYERRIVELETELSVRTEENRELLKLKIDLLRQQIETERGRRSVNFN